MAADNRPTREKILAAGTPQKTDSADPWAAYEGRQGGQLRVVLRKDGETLADGLAVTELSADFIDGGVRGDIEVAGLLVPVEIPQSAAHQQRHKSL